MQSRSRRSADAMGGLTLVLATLAASCSVTAGPAGAPPASPSAAGSEGAAISAEVTVSPSNPTDATSVVGPPVAALAAEGGDPIDGQLGTYVWDGSGSDSPWLPGARIAVGSGEPLTVRFRPVISVATWRARSVRSTADGPAGATVLGQGSGDPLFAAPDPGTWTIEVHVVFASGTGAASYFWQLAVD